MNSTLHLIPATPFTADGLRRTLPPFAFSQPLPDSELLHAYRRYYGIDFETRFADLDVSIGQVHVAGYDIAVQSFIPPQARATVFVVHGYYDHVGIFDHLIEALLQRNFAVMAFDLPGHGMSSGCRATIYNFHQYQPVLQRIVQLASGNLPKPWHFAAQSTGGSIVCEYLLNFSSLPERLPFTCAVLMAPLIRPVNWWLNRHMHSLLSPFKDFVPRKYTRNSHDSDFVQFCRSADPLQPRFLSSRWVGSLKQWIPFIERHESLHFPTLIIQGQEDETVDWRHNTELLQRKFLPTELFFIASVRHQVVNESADLRQQVFARLSHFLLAHS